VLLHLKINSSKTKKPCLYNPFLAELFILISLTVVIIKEKQNVKEELSQCGG